VRRKCFYLNESNWRLQKITYGGAYDLYSSEIIMEMKSRRQGTSVVHNAHGKVRNTCKILVGKHDAKRPIERLGIKG
jgi:hypothetical protein